jgi:hypothetical protein
MNVLIFMCLWMREQLVIIIDNGKNFTFNFWNWGWGSQGSEDIGSYLVGSNTRFVGSANVSENFADIFRAR